MNVNNIFAGILGMVMSMSLIFLFWTPIQGFLSGIKETSMELYIFLSIAWVCFFLIIGFLAPLNLATSDDKGNN